MARDMTDVRRQAKAAVARPERETKITRKAKARKPKGPAPKPSTPLVLTKPGSKKTKLPIVGLEKNAARIRANKAKIEALATEVEIDAHVVIDRCMTDRRDAETAGNFHTTCEVASGDGKPVQVVFQNKYSKIDMEHEESLKEALNSHYDSMIRRGVDVKVKPDVTLDKIREALGDQFDALLALVDVVEYLTPGKDFMDKRASRRSSMTPDENQKVDDIIDQCQYSPQVRTK